MKKVFFLLVTFIVILTCQISFLYNISLFDIYPNILIIFVVWFALWRGPLEGQIMGFFVGIIQDSFSVGIFGINALALTGIGLLMGLLKKNIEEENKLMQMLLGFISSFFYCLCFWILTSIVGEGKDVILGKILLLLPLYNGIITPLLFMVLDLWANLWGEKFYVAD